MSQTYVAETTHRLHDAVLRVVREAGPSDAEWLARRLRRDLRDGEVDVRAVRDVVAVSTLLVPLPDGRVQHTLPLLEGAVLTHRARVPLAGRTDLWATCGLQPLLNLLTVAPLPLADGTGEVVRSQDHDVLMGPPGWLPDVGRHELLGLRLVDGALHLEPVGAAALPVPERELELRELLSETYRRAVEPWSGSRRPEAAGLARTVNVALLADPDLLATPLPPLEELLHNPLGRGLDVGHWRSVALGTQAETVGAWLDGIPVALWTELGHRARRYGMAEGQFVVALLSQLAWRTPFAEDMEPWEQWLPDRAPVTDVEHG